MLRGIGKRLMPLWMIFVCLSSGSAWAQTYLQGPSLDSYESYVERVDADRRQLREQTSNRYLTELHGIATNERFEPQYRSVAYTLYASISGRLVEESMSHSMARASISALKWALHLDPHNLRAIKIHAEALIEIHSRGYFISQLAARVIGLNLEQERQYALRNLRGHPRVERQQELIDRLEQTGGFLGGGWYE